MPAILLVRHGQALDPLSGGYDGLSELGQRQAARVAAALAGVKVARAYSGPGQRHILTAKHGWPVQGAQVLPALDEHRGHQVLEQLAAHPELANDEARAALAAAEREGSRGAMAKVVAAVVRGWARGEIAAPVDEPFAAFRERVRGALAALGTGLEGSDAALAFTSGGFIGSAVAECLGATPDAAVELGLQVDNASITELRFSRREPNRFVLKRFNVAAHLGELLTGL